MHTLHDSASFCSGGAGKVEVIAFSCSGAADVGELADQAARQLDHDGSVAFSCLAAIAAGSARLRKSAACQPVMALDGCEASCTRKTLEKAGIAPTYQLRVTDLGMQKGQIQPDTDNLGLLSVRHLT